jgi:hypothetical protein
VDTVPAMLIACRVGVSVEVRGRAGMGHGVYKGPSD